MRIGLCFKTNGQKLIILSVLNIMMTVMTMLIVTIVFTEEFSPASGRSWFRDLFGRG